MVCVIFFIFLDDKRLVGAFRIRFLRKKFFRMQSFNLFFLK